MDSGSTSSFLPREIAVDILDLPVTHRDSPVDGAGGTFMCDIVKAKSLEIMKGLHPIHEYRDRLLYVPRPPVELPYGILGRDTIFRDFEITFRELDQRFILR